MPKVLVGMSGGVDSAVCALLLKEQGHDVTGITLKIWREGDSGIESDCNNDYLKAASLAAKKIGIEHRIIDISREFHNSVVTYFVDGYLAGKTPFPCAVCNPQLKWKTLLELAKTEGYDKVATGHYARIEEKNNKLYITRGLDPEKDQSFFLWGLDQDALTKTLFPLGNYLKEEVKEIAIKHNIASEILEKESIGLCFAEQNNYRVFLKKQIENRGIVIKEGWFVDNKSGKYLSRHKGFPYYTVGQRHGLKINSGTALYVQSVDSKENLVYVGEKKDLFKTSFQVRDYRFADISELQSHNVFTVKIRYRKQLNKCTLEIIDAKLLRINLIEPLDAVASGQAAVFYNKDRLIGGGFIE